MTRLITIIVLIALAYLLVRYNTNPKLQRWVVIALVSSIALYTVLLMISELSR